MHQMPRLAVTVWLATGIWCWGHEFMASNMETLVRAGTLFTMLDVITDVDGEVRDA